MLNDQQWQQLLEGFIAESADLIQRSEESLAALEGDLHDNEAINELFRAVHTLKGSAGLLGLETVVAFTHEFENVLMGVRDGEVVLQPALIKLAFKCLDYLAALMEQVSQGNLESAEPERAETLKQQLRAFQAPSSATASPAQVETAAYLDDIHQAADSRWHISLRFPANLFELGFDPASFLKYLDRLGQVADVFMLTDAFPETLGEYEPESCYFGLEIQLVTSAGKAEIEQAFEFILDVAQIEILPPDSKLEDYLQLIRELPEADQRLGEILVQCGAMTPREVAQALGVQASSRGGKKIGEVIVEQGSAPAEAVNEALAKQRRKPADTQFLRIGADKLDTLINQVGELVIAAAGAKLLAAQRSDPELTEMAEGIHHHVEMIRESALQLRMVEIGETFNRFHRVVRETAEALNKDIRLEIQGADTELDKTLVDKIHDPLVHLVRNAMDHGIESPDERVAAGKPAQGRVALNAYYESGMIVIEVTDDGRGIDVDRVWSKAVAAGVVNEGDEMDEQDKLKLIFHPGLSTANSVSNLSGRGVGMDSVRQDIDALRGSIDIDNRPGEGCRLRIRLPLTLAIIDGFLVSVAEQYFVIPTDWVVECVEAPQAVPSKAHEGYMELRGQPLPYITLREKFVIAGQQPRRQSMVVVSHGQDRAGLLVDALHGEIQTVIKPLGSLFEHLSGVSGGTILGSGRVALTLDVPGLMASVHQSENATVH
ncbi:chemotaxis protein CheA [Marinobacteraceae bacterium S3BR75-40.1]